MLAPGTQFEIVKYPDGNVVGGVFRWRADDRDLRDGDLIVMGLNSYRINYNATNITLTVVDPLAVTLGWFLAERSDETIVFQWQTATENGTAGFHLLALVDGERVRLNPALIPSPVIDSVTPTDYTFSADTHGSQFYLQEVTISGAVYEYGPFTEGEASGTHLSQGEDDMVPMLWLPLSNR